MSQLKTDRLKPDIQPCYGEEEDQTDNLSTGGVNVSAPQTILIGEGGIGNHHIILQMGREDCKKGAKNY